uniref:Uncharacterized protein n=1 Tax=Oryza sativa subsp. japonica TaxID=39947 RepID=Q8H804_ORYSJ|nr:hypothetical protein [Oryza sativa Japonica Group]
MSSGVVVEGVVMASTTKVMSTATRCSSVGSLDFHVAYRPGVGDLVVVGVAAWYKELSVLEVRLRDEEVPLRWHRPHVGGSLRWRWVGLAAELAGEVAVA